MSRLLIVGISGVTNGGKTSIISQLLKYLPNNTQVLSQDDYFYPCDSPRHIPSPGPIDHFNWDVISSIDMDKMLQDINSISGGLTSSGHSLLLLDGFLLFDDERIRQLCDLKFFFTLSKEVCLKRRLLRHYEPPDPVGYFDYCVWPMHESHLQRLSKYDIQYLNGESDVNSNFSFVMQVIKEKLDNL